MYWSKKGEYTKTLHIISYLDIKYERKRIFEKKKEKKKAMKKTASSPEQDLHPDWDRFRGTMLYLLSCGELAMNGEKILRWYETSEARAARKK